MKEPKFEIKPSEKLTPKQEPSAEGKPRPEEREIEAWEDEGGAAETEVETGEETPVEVPETVVEESQVKLSWREILIQMRSELPENIQPIIDKVSQKAKLEPKEQSTLDKFAHWWFRETLGLKLKNKPTVQGVKDRITEVANRTEVKKVPELNKRKGRKKEEKKLAQLTSLSAQKRKKMEQLHLATRNLDDGEPVEEFRDETRRVVYFDEEASEYYVDENGVTKNIGIGDIASDYAWGIKYVPDGEMIEPVYRTLAKRILTNETRRDLETIHNIELHIQKGVYGSALYPLSEIKTALETEIGGKEMSKGQRGGIAGLLGEIAIREFLSRISLNNALDLAVSRATFEEDAEFKYDFKVRIIRRVRGVNV
ncbi:MAG: hypothetical protein AAB799_00055, partial [Patescibacteria group bacterium]